MEMTGERRIGAPRERVWEALNDPQVLQAAIPGCESVERIGDDQFQAKVSMKLGPMSAKFGGKVTLSNIVPPASYTISGEGQGGAMGFAKGGADVALEALGPSDTLLKYNVKAQVGGKMAQLGARLIDSTAKSMADQFFDRFAAQLQPAPETVAPEPMAAAAEPPAEAALAAPVAGTDTEYLADRRGTAPITHHGADGVSPGGAVQRPGPAPAEMPLPLRLLTQDFMGFPAQVWLGGAAMLAVLAIIFLT
ncbi:CoxG family protein [Falsiroseomonas selenitidurans]|uniref:Carbon monoxide dehydrogenase subunit G n=1 Tax=Falsiroseomonas selenitidurans TaxID=2716335 RepID=A0ABX1E3G6_9PROT|nr:carbon monoxide dehydrogenase subunit G [Falsiroseomonas selenitidurans]NKC31563.1 carbon monoxide dehydrogenase subunit G [Falsiroseomonas selenitidurans]